MPGPKKLDIEIYSSAIYSVWFGCLALPFRTIDIHRDRSLEMIDMYLEMNKNIKNGTYKPAEILQKRLMSIYEVEEDEKAQKPAAYTSSIDDINSRED